LPGRLSYCLSHSASPGEIHTGFLLIFKCVTCFPTCEFYEFFVNLGCYLFCLNAVLDIKPKIPCMFSECCTTELILPVPLPPPPPVFFFWQY
jgi:hypothetical protein